MPYLSNTPDLVQHGAEDLAEEIRRTSAGKPCYGPNEWGTECGKCSKCKPASAEPSAPVERDELMELLRDMTYAYRGAIQAGYDRITSLGGECDSVDKMLADFPAYAKARSALERKPS